MGLGGIFRISRLGVFGAGIFYFPAQNPSFSPISLRFSFGGCRLFGRVGLGGGWARCWVRLAGGRPHPNPPPWGEGIF